MLFQTPSPAAAQNPATPSPAVLYEALTNQKDVLQGQLEELTTQRAELTDQLARTGSGDASRKGIEERITALDKRIAATDDQVGNVDLQIAKAAAIPGAIVPRAPIVRSGPPDEVFVLAGIFMIVVLLPLTIAYARRIWRRGATVVSPIPSDLMARIQRIEHAVETSGLEIERIGEGQRFITKLFSEKLTALPAAREEAREPKS